MHPILFRIGGVPIYAHGFFLCLGLLIGLLMLIMEAQRRRWPKGEVIPITLAAFVGGMIGARIALLFFYGASAAPAALNMFALFDPRIGPGSILGGLIGAYIAGYIASRAVSPGTQYLAVFRFVSTSAFMGYSLGLIPFSIWYQRNWMTTWKSVFDGLVYACVTAGTFGWLWPR